MSVRSPWFTNETQSEWKRLHTDFMGAWCRELPELRMKEWQELEKYIKPQQKSATRHDILETLYHILDDKKLSPEQKNLFGVVQQFAKHILLTEYTDRIMGK